MHDDRTLDWAEAQYWAGTRARLDEATALPSSAYVDDAFFEQERVRVFERAWVCVGIIDDLQAAGDVAVRQLGGRSILITLDGDGVIGGFVNACRHRGTELLHTDATGVSTIRCPYHRWGYDLAGRLISTPLFESGSRSSPDPAPLGLAPVRIDTWGCLIFACLDPATPSLQTWLGDLPERMAAYGLDRWRTHQRRNIDIAANWKLISENFQEYYHLPWVHPELAKVSRVEDHHRYQGQGMYCGQTTTPISADTRDDWLRLPPAQTLGESDATSGRFIAIFPNVLLSVLPNHTFVMRLEPSTSGRTREECTFLLPPATDEPNEDAFAATRRFWFDVNDEDIDIVERGQRGLRNAVSGPGPLAPRFEEPLHRFHNMLADCMTLPDLRSITIPAGDPSNPPTAADAADVRQAR